MEYQWSPFLFRRHGNAPVTGGFPSQRASKTKSVYYCMIWYVTGYPIVPVKYNRHCTEDHTKSGLFNTFRPREMATILRRTFSNAFSWLKNSFCVKISLFVLLGVPSTMRQLCCNWRGADQTTSQYPKQCWLSIMTSCYITGSRQINEYIWILIESPLNMFRWIPLKKGQ